MRKIQPPFAKMARAECAIFASDLPRLSQSWLLACDINQHSPRTIGARKELLGKLAWFLNERQFDTCGIHELRHFLHYVTHGHKEPGGRWGNPRCTTPTKPGTVKTYHRILRAFFNWLVAEGEIEQSPMERIPAPVDRPDEIQPFTREQLEKLLKAADRSKHPLRDEAILLLLMDTGMRAEELCSLTWDDVNLQEAYCRIRDGKGGKGRVAPLAPATKRALYKYLNEREYEPNTALFLSDRGRDAGGGLTRHGLRFLIIRLGKAAKITNVRLSPHTFRHTFAVEFLRAGGQVFALQQMLGHTSLAMTNRYVALAQADIANQHRQFSLVSRLKSKKMIKQ